MRLNASYSWLNRGVFVVVCLLATIGVVVVVRRSLTLVGILAPTVHPIYGVFDGAFARYPQLTFVHIIPGALFMVLAPFQFMRSIRARHLTFHRWVGRMLVVLGGVIGVTALIMAFKTPIGGANETAATVVFALVFLFALGKGFLHVRRREIASHREWMLRMFAIGLAIATVRPIVGMFFGFTSLSPHEFFGIAFWLGFTLHLLAAEAWINLTRQRQQRVAVSQPS